MEHKLITGGEQWLPFARSRIKALRATGLAHASQKFEVEGALIDVRIEPGHEYIRIEGGVSEIYLETGQLNWAFHGIDDPRWAEAATWKFMDIPTTAKYLGKAKIGKEGRGDQVNSPDLTNGMRSKAIGWPLADLGSTTANEPKDKETQEKYFDYTMTKKKALSIFPASLFSGKMRLFMQSLYGAKEPDPDNPKAYFPLVLDDLDAPTVLSLRSSLDGGAMLIARSDSMGIFTAPDDTYWLLDINEGPRNVLVNKINTTKARALVKQLKTMSADERTKAEAYIFANSKIEIPKPEDTVYATGTFPGVVGSPMAYGWKWSESGAKASIVVHEQIGETIPETRWHARTVHLTFTYSEGVISVSGTVEDHNDWIDGWGEYNMFVPGIPPVLDLYTLRAGSGLIPPLIPFPSTPIYGWYTGESWTPLMLQATSETVVTLDSSSSGITYAYGASCPPHSMAPTAGGMTDGLKAWSAEWLETTYAPGRIVSFAGVSIDGRHKTLSGRKDECSGTASDDNTWPTAPGGAPGGEWIGQWLSTDGGDGFPPSTFFTEMKSLRDASPHIFCYRFLWGQSTRKTTYQSGGKQDLFAICIPHGDCEALYIVRKVTPGPEITVRDQTAYSPTGLHMFAWDSSLQIQIPQGDGAFWLAADWPGMVDDGWQSTWANNNAPGVTQYGPPASVTTTVSPPAATELKVMCFNSKVRGLEGVPGGSYAGLFDVDYRWPQYDRGMYTFTSYGGRYIMSEAPSNPTSITWHNFVGWA